jgi:general nucleoside transport system ATP-binding protein
VAASAKDEIVLSSITKRFGEIVANDNVDLTIRRGEIHALLGENGAGKSTLMNVLSGVYVPDHGTITFQGERVRFRSPWDAIRRGVGMVHQHFELVEAFSVLDNIELSATDTSLLMNARAAMARIEEVGKAHGLHVDPQALIWQLTVGERQKVEILRLLYRGADLLLLDEPTSMLTPDEVDDLFKALRRLAKSGKYVVLITHKLREVAAVADRVTVLRRGRVVASLAAGESSLRDLGGLMVGAALPETPRTHGLASSDVVLRLEEVHAAGERGGSGLKGASLELRRGEIVGVAGVAGNGQLELAECIAGLRPVRRGSIWLKDAEITRLGPLERLRSGLRFVPEDRLGMGLVPQLDMADNVVLRDFREPGLRRGPFLSRRVARERAKRVMKDYDVRAPDIETPLRSLSGGNQQKILVGRELLPNPTVLIVAQPTRGLDISATRAVHDRLFALRDSGAGVLLISEDLDEVLQLSDRIAVMFNGEVRRTWPRQKADRSEIGAVMGGHFLEVL